MTDDQAALANFKGVARLFPLPNLVLFPQVVQGLHVFEPRYRQLMADALADDKLISLVLLQPVAKVYQAGRMKHRIAQLSVQSEVPAGMVMQHLHGLPVRHPVDVL